MSGTQFNISYSGGNYYQWCWIDGTHVVTYNSGTVLPSNQWVHLAWSRSGNSFKTFVNGILNHSVSYTNVPSNQATIITVGGDAAGYSQYFKGYIDDLRVTKGVARYTTNFTPPERSFLNQ